MNPQIRHVQRACEAAKARQAVTVFIDESGQYAVASYGETKAECAAVKPVCVAIEAFADVGWVVVNGDYRHVHGVGHRQPGSPGRSPGRRRRGAPGFAE